VADQEQVAGNALGKVSFPGLQKYLKVNYDPARDNQELAEIVQSTRQHLSHNKRENLHKRSWNYTSPNHAGTQWKIDPAGAENSAGLVAAIWNSASRT